MIVKVLDQKTPDVLVVPVFQDDHLATQLSQIASQIGVDAKCLEQDFKAEAKEFLLLYTNAAKTQKIYLAGLGKPGRMSEVRAVFRSFAYRFQKKLPAKVGVDLRQFHDQQLSQLAEEATGGMLMGLYSTESLMGKTNKEQKFGAAKSELQILVGAAVEKSVTHAVSRGEELAIINMAAMDLVNLPGNYKYPRLLANRMLKLASAYGIKAKLLEESDLKKEGMDALLAVGQGSPHPSLMLWLEYGTKPGKKSRTPVVGLVGKGVTFDTGGISIKPSASMQFMKSDMGGAAAVLGTFMAAARMKLPVRLVGAIPLAENMVDGTAIKPGDVIGSHSGKSIEVIDTDAEGRLILADGLSYLTQKENPDTLIDIATLTGSVIRAIGVNAAGLFTPNDALSRSLYDAGMKSGEQLWPFPMWEAYGSDLKSDVADLKNFTGKPMAECISAAKFLENFTREHPRWAHLDIAGMAFGDAEHTKAKSATGYGIRLLLKFLEGLVEKGAEE